MYFSVRLRSRVRGGWPGEHSRLQRVRTRQTGRRRALLGGCRNTRGSSGRWGARIVRHHLRRVLETVVAFIALGCDPDPEPAAPPRSPRGSCINLTASYNNNSQITAQRTQITSFRDRFQVCSCPVCKSRVTYYDLLCILVYNVLDWMSRLKIYSSAVPTMNKKIAVPSCLADHVKS